MGRRDAAARATGFAIELDGCTFTYGGAPRASLVDVSLEVPSGQCVVVTGRSGCGKTTLTRLVNALIPMLYEGELEGTVRVMGTPVPEWRAEELFARVGSVFQNPHSQFVNLDVTSELAFGCESLGMDRRDMVERVGRAAEMLGIEELLGRDTRALSGGQKQSVILGSVCAVHPDVFVFDEPTASLDVHAMRRLARVIALLKEQGKTVLVSEHRLWWLEGVADRYVLMENGSISADWTAEQFAALPLADRSAHGLRAASVREIDSLCFDLFPAPGHGPRRTCAGGGAVARMRGVEAGYRGRPAVLDGIDFELEPGRIVGLVGRNGAGKTTLSRCMAGLVRERSGLVELDGRRVRARDRAGRVYLVMQDPGYQLFESTVEGELAEARRAGRARAPARAGLVDGDVEESLGLTGLGSRHPLSLSGGERQRLSIAVGLLSGAEAMILDEPTSGLDYLNMRTIARQLSQMRDAGVGICVVSHDYEFLCSVCDEVALVEGGRISERFSLDKTTLCKLKRNFGFAEKTDRERNCNEG